MAGDFGTSKTGAEHFYYTCANKKKRKACNMKSFRKDQIEEAVVRETVEQVLNDETIESIADDAIRAQGESNSYIEKLEADIKACDKAMANLVKAIEQGIDAPEVQARLAELREQKEKLSHSLNWERMVKPRLSREQVIAWLSSYKGGDIKDPEYAKRIVELLVSDVTVHEDKMVVRYNVVDKKNSPLHKARASSSKVSMVEQTVACSNPYTDGENIYLSIASSSFRYTSSGLACLSNSSHTPSGHENCTLS